MHLIIGGNGLVGSALGREMTRRELPWLATTRRRPDLQSMSYLDLANLPPERELPRNADYVYLVAAISKLAECERDPSAWRVNVDAPITLARHYHRYGTAIVFISSDAVETCQHTAYARQKAAVESYMHTIDAAIVRAGRVVPERADEFAAFVVDVALSHRSGVRRWPLAENVAQARAA